MGKLIATTQATIDGVIDLVGEWVQEDGDHSAYSLSVRRDPAGWCWAARRSRTCSGSTPGWLSSPTSRRLDRDQGGFAR